MATIIQNGTLVTTSEIFKADLKVDNGKISMISDKIHDDKNDTVIDATNKYILPGLIDAHAHLAIEGTLDDFESGTKAAASGGITTLINFTDPEKSQSFVEDLYDWKNKAKSSLIDYGFHSIINKCNKDVLKQIPKLVDEGVTSIKLFTAYKENMVNDEELYLLMKEAKKAGVVVNVHCENGKIIDQLIEEALENEDTDPIYHAYTRPPAAEAEATSRVLRIAEITGAPTYIVHISCEEALKEFTRAKERGVTAFGETCPQYLVLNESYLKMKKEEAVKYICSPPLRKEKDQEVLWEGIEKGTISTIGSDHASHPYIGGKEKGIDNFTKAPNGLPGIENTLLLLYNFGVIKGNITLSQLVKVTSENPAKIFGLHPKKGSLSIGSDGDLVIFDPNASNIITKETQKQRTEYNVYESMEVQGKIDHVLSRGEVIVENGEVIDNPGRGEYIYRKKFKFLKNAEQEPEKNELLSNR
ncbi:dihydropyrimidinase [Lacicoccus qingdaonensis]|uniref:Dihydropyrimidinase n=1 Tax=Lacicoccus qingdaonensis TaxID=576118 RepID=A0A1G9JA63_9BACL|nr:dihydropyrimidinase [Salinicoccus qingdaonensis]SDL34449.1 dihydropyrimidinase [Salinicoccus qingdaonensis]